MTILVTGATGAIGGRVVDRLVAAGEFPRIASHEPSELRARWADLSSALARPLIEGMATPLVVRDDEARRRFLDIDPMPFVDALRRALAEV